MFVVLSATSLAQATIVGDWELTFRPPAQDGTAPPGAAVLTSGANSLTVSFKQDGDKITSELASPLGSVQLSGAETPDGQVTLAGSLNLQGLVVELGLAAKIAGEALEGTVMFGALGDFPFTGKRVEKTDVSGTWTVTVSIPGAEDVGGTLTLAQTADKVSGVLTNRFGELQVSGAVNGNNLQLEYTVEMPSASHLVAIVGQLGPDGFTGRAIVSGIGEGEWSGVRTPR
jgi:hypothetical protein